MYKIRAVNDLSKMLRKGNRLSTLCLLLLLSCFQAKGQNVYIPNENFKNYLLNNGLINTNGDNEIQISEAEVFTGTISVSNLGIDDLTGIESFSALTELHCAWNSLSELNLSNNTALVNLKCDNNQLSFLDLSNNMLLSALDCRGNNLSELILSNNLDLHYLSCGHNSLTSLDVSENLGLMYLYCGPNNLESLDLSNNILLRELSCTYNSLTSLNVQNGFNTNFLNFNHTYFYTHDNPDLLCIEVDDVEWALSHMTMYIDPWTAFDEDCSTLVGMNDHNDLDGRGAAYPNPAVDVLVIGFDSFREGDIAVYDLNGRMFFQQSYSDMLDVSTLPSGMYILELHSGSTSERRRFIKQ